MSSDITIRRFTAGDIQRCGEIVVRAFQQIAEAHNFATEFPEARTGPALMTALANHPAFYGVVAEQNGKVIGSSFLDERDAIAGIGPVTVDPDSQNKSAGKEMMHALLARAKEKNFAGVRLIQAAYHNRSLSLYTKLGFIVREPLATMQGKPPTHARSSSAKVRAMTERDLDVCDALCTRVHGHTRHNELRDAITRSSGLIVERDGRISGYASLLGFFGHSVGESNDDLKSLISNASSLEGPGILVPTRNHELFRWCLENGLRVISPMTLMSVGLYNQPAGAFLPSILY